MKTPTKNLIARIMLPGLALWAATADWEFPGNPDRPPWFWCDLSAAATKPPTANSPGLFCPAPSQEGTHNA